MKPIYTITLAPSDHWAGGDLRAAIRAACDLYPRLLEIQIRIRCAPEWDEQLQCYNRTSVEGREAGIGEFLSQLLERVLQRKGNHDETDH